ncbi:MAG TPA: hypothetical protein VK842_06870 [bacterium]|nr:hypothetical protein [bacterium]
MLSDRDGADQIFGNASTLGQSPAPPANHFAYPIPIGMGARAEGMGEAFSALSDDLSAIWWNPAGLVQMDKNQIEWEGGDREAGIPYTGFFAANYMLQNRMNFGLSYSRPYHDVGAIPNVNAGTYTGAWTKLPAGGLGPGGSPGTLVIPGGGSEKFTDIPDTAVQAFLKNLYRLYINPAFQEDVLAFTYATPLSPDNDLSLGINVKYYMNDQNYTADNQLLNSVSGYGVDLGFLYRYPMLKWGREVAVALNIQNVAAQVRFNDNPGAGREVTLPQISTLGFAWKTTEFITRSDMNLTMDFVYINDPSFDDNANRKLNLGGEMWFFKHRLAPRLGYTMFFNRELSRPTIGISFRTLQLPDKAAMGLDYAYLFPADNETTAENWFSLNFWWGGVHTSVPLPEVSVTVDPPIFAPKHGETATFTMKADSPDGIDRWSLSIIDHNNVVVKTYSDRGEAPSQIVWGGEDKLYRLLPDGEYTYLFTATDHNGSSSSTAVQTLKIYTPAEPEVQHDEIDQLRKLIRAQDEKEEAGDQAVKADTLKSLQGIIGNQASNQTIPAVAKAPVAPAPETPLAEARAAAGAFSYPNVNDVPFPKTTLSTGEDGKKVYTVQFSSTADNPRQILKDIADVVRVSAQNVGLGVARYDVTATYGTRELRVVAPASAAMDLGRGQISREQFLGNAAVTLDGSPLSPSFQ